MRARFSEKRFKFSLAPVPFEIRKFKGLSAFHSISTRHVADKVHGGHVICPSAFPLVDVRRVAGATQEHSAHASEELRASQKLPMSPDHPRSARTATVPVHGASLARPIQRCCGAYVKALTGSDRKAGLPS